MQLTKDSISGTFRPVVSDIDRMSPDGMTTLGTMSFQQFKPTDWKASNPAMLITLTVLCNTLMVCITAVPRCPAVLSSCAVLSSVAMLCCPVKELEVPVVLADLSVQWDCLQQ